MSVFLWLIPHSTVYFLITQDLWNVKYVCMYICLYIETKKKKLHGLSKLYRPSDRYLSAKLMPTFADVRVSHSQGVGSPTGAATTSFK
jgi:hypothetical protein